MAYDTFTIIFFTLFLAFLSSLFTSYITFSHFKFLFFPYRISLYLTSSHLRLHLHYTHAHKDRLLPQTIISHISYDVRMHGLTMIIAYFTTQYSLRTGSEGRTGRVTYLLLSVFGKQFGAPHLCSADVGTEEL